jgi:O-antigen/teichoic acid export membrane protein
MWAKLNANERLVGYGAIIVFISWLVGLVGGGAGGYGFITAVIVIVIYWLKYAPNSNITWPLPVPTLVLLITGISALLAILAVLPVLGLGLFFYGGLWLIAYLGGVVGVIVMAYGAWREYQSAPKASA